MQTNSLSKTGAKIVIAINGKTNGNGGLYAVTGNGEFSNQRTRTVAGIIAIERGWEISVKMFTKNKMWVAKRASGFSCHLLKTFDGCTNERAHQIQAQMLGRMHDRNSTAPIETNVLMSSSDAIVDHPNRLDVDAGAAIDVSCSFVCVILVIALTTLPRQMEHDR